ncbi:acyltransferase, partial [Acinetobacter baumannii]
ISGFLITGILRKQLAAGHFGIGTFYAHRIRRIFPALCAVLLATFLMGWLLAVPEDFQLIGKHMATGAGFVQNFALLQEAGYFDV